MVTRSIIIIFFLTALLEAAPRAYDSLGNELEAQSDDCKIYLKLESIPSEIKKSCKLYISKVNKAFLVGYKADKLAKKPNLYEKKLESFYKLMLDADKTREYLVDLIDSKIRKAQKQDDLKCYSQLIRGKQIQLNSKDYKFIGDHAEDMKDNPRFIEYRQRKEAAILRKKQAEESNRKRALMLLKAGEKAENSQGVKHDYKKSKKYYEQACTLRNMKACIRFATLVFYGHGVKKNPAFAAGAFMEGCERGSYLACNMLGVAYRYGKGVPKNMSKAKELYQRTCTDKSNLGCESLGMMYYGGEGVIQDNKKARHYYKKGCEGGDLSACALLGSLHEEGVGGNVDIKMAYQYYKEACNGGERYACEYAKKLNYSEKSEIYQDMCERGKAKMCTKIGMMYALGKEIKVDYRKGLKLFKKACEMGDSAGCIEAAWTYTYAPTGISRDISMAKYYYGLACDLKDREGCENYIIFDEKGY